MDGAEYLVGYGNAGEFSRFRPTAPADYRRGDRVVVRSPQGLELGTVLCPVTPAHLDYLSQTGVGELLRTATVADEQTVQQAQELGRRIFEEARRLVAELDLPLEILDAEILFDRQQVILHHLRQLDCDYRPLVSAIARKYDLLVVMQNLAFSAGLSEEEEAPGCGKPDCGQAGGGGCSSCGTGGGCSSGACGSGIKAEEVTTFLTRLRERTEAGASRVPLV